MLASIVFPAGKNLESAFGFYYQRVSVVIEYPCDLKVIEISSLISEFQILSIECFQCSTWWFLMRVLRWSKIFNWCLAEEFKRKMIAKIIHSHLSCTFKKSKLDPRSLFGVLIWYFPILCTLVSLFSNVVWDSLIRKIFLFHIFFKKNIRTLVPGGEGCSLRAYVHVQRGRGA